MTETFGEWLTKRLELLGIKPAELARRSGVSKQYVSGLMKNRPHSDSQAAPQPKAETVRALARGMGVNEGEALLAAGYAAPATAPSDFDAERLLLYFRELPEECRKDVLVLTEALWRRRRTEGRAERVERSTGGKHSPEVVKPGVERRSRKRRAG